MLRVRGQAPDFDVERAGFDIVATDGGRAWGVARGEFAEVGQVAGDRDGAAEGAVLEDADGRGERAVDNKLTGFDIGVTGVGVGAREGQGARAVLPEAARAADGAGDGGGSGGIEHAARAGEGDVVGDGRTGGEDRAAVVEGQKAADQTAVRACLVVEGDELAAFDEGRGVGAGGGSVVLGGDDEPLATEDAIIDDRGDVDDARVFFVDGLEVDGARGETATVRFEDLHGCGFNLGLSAGEGVNNPVLGDVFFAPWVFLDVEEAVITDGDVVEAGSLGAVLAGQFGAVDEHLNGAAGRQDFAEGAAIEVELIDFCRDVGHAVHRRAGGGEDQGVVVEPLGVFGAGELGYLEAE